MLNVLSFFIGILTQYSVAIVEVLDSHLYVLDAKVQFQLVQLEVGAAIALVRCPAEVHLGFDTVWKLVSTLDFCLSFV